ncbi:hypothetical protein [Nocardia sp. NPDC004860]|uniref:hypothetical protein n=1 Tax=Nocardia sp. NPDC004860 TaxID=3154557 RepID=UPI0033A068ED
MAAAEPVTRSVSAPTVSVAAAIVAVDVAGRCAIPVFLIFSSHTLKLAALQAFSVQPNERIRSRSGTLCQGVEELKYSVQDYRQRKVVDREAHRPFDFSK